MPISWSQYKTAADGKIEAMLQASNDVRAVESYLSGTDTRIIYATASGICCVQRTAAGVTSKKGYFAEGDINGIAISDAHLYVAWGTLANLGSMTGNVGKIALSSLFDNGDSDRVADYDDDWGTTGGGPPFAVAGKIYGIAAGLIEGKWYLAIARTVNIYWYCIDDETSFLALGYYGNLAPCSHIKIKDGYLFAANDFQAGYKKDPQDIAAAAWQLDGYFGRIDDTFDRAAVPAQYGLINLTTCDQLSVANAGGKMTISGRATAAGASSVLMRHNCFMVGDFDIKLKGLGGTNPGANTSGTKDITRRLDFYTLADGANARGAIFQSWYNAAGNERIRNYGEIRTGNVVRHSTNETGVVAAFTPAQQSDATSGGGLRIYRVGNIITLAKADYPAPTSWATLATWESADFAGPLQLVFQLALTDWNASTATWDFVDIDHGSALDVVTKYPENKIIKGMAGSKPAAVLNCLAAYENTGMMHTEINETNYLASTWYDYLESGGDATITSDDVTCLGLDSTGLLAWLGSDAGFDKINIAAQTFDHFDMDRGKLIQNAVACVKAGSASYGSSGGAGWLSGDATAPDDGEIFAAGENEDDALVGFRASASTDADVAHLHRKKGSAAELTLMDDYTWDTVGTPLEFDVSADITDERLLAVLDEDLPDGKYTYRVSQFDEAGNESTGAEAVVYVDEPVVAVSIADGASGTTSRGIALSITGDSGDDSGNESTAGAVWSLELSENSGFSNSLRVRPVGASPWTIPWYLSSGDGLKTIYCRGVAQGGLLGASDSTSITLAESVSPIAGTTAEKIMLTKQISSDKPAVVFTSEKTDTDFPPANVQEKRLNRVWRPTEWSDETGDYANYEGRTAKGAIIIADLGAAKTIDLAWIGGHNLTLLASASMDPFPYVYLCGSSTNYVTTIGPTHSRIYNWLNGAAYVANLTDNIALGGGLCIRPEVSYRYWALIVFTYLRTGSVSNWLPYIGRICLVESADIWQPNINFDRSFKQTIKDQSTLIETEDEVYEAILKNRRAEYDLSFSTMTRANWATARGVLTSLGKTEPTIAVLYPNEVPSGAFAPPSNPTYPSYWTLPPLYCNIDGDWSLKGLAGDNASFEMKLREITGGQDPYGS